MHPLFNHSNAILFKHFDITLVSSVSKLHLIEVVTRRYISGIPAEVFFFRLKYQLTVSVIHFNAFKSTLQMVQRLGFFLLSSKPPNAYSSSLSLYPSPFGVITLMALNSPTGTIFTNISSIRPNSVSSGSTGQALSLTLKFNLSSGVSLSSQAGSQKKKIVSFFSTYCNGFL